MTAVLKCPFCNKTFNNIGGLTNHFRAIHQRDFNNVCPFCRKKFKSLTLHAYKHFEFHKDSEHATLYYLLCYRMGRNRKYKRLWQSAVDAALKALTVKEVIV